MAIIQIHDNQITNGSIIGTQNIYEVPQDIDWGRIESELDELIQKLPRTSELQPAVNELKDAVKHRKWESFKRVAKEFAADFSSAAFANLASGALLSVLLPK